jgi:hypothetical protein
MFPSDYLPSDAIDDEDDAFMDDAEPFRFHDGLAEEPFRADESPAPRPQVLVFPVLGLYSSVVEQLEMSPEFGQGLIRIALATLIEIAQRCFGWKVRRAEKRNKKCLIRHFEQNRQWIRAQLQDPEMRAAVLDCIKRQIARK